MTSSVLLRCCIGFNSEDDEIEKGRNRRGVGKEIDGEEKCFRFSREEKELYLTAIHVVI